MGGLFGKQKSVKAPKPVSPAPIPETTGEVGDTEVKRIRKQMGYQKSILTGALTPESGKKTTLG